MFSQAGARAPSRAINRLAGKSRGPKNLSRQVFRAPKSSFTGGRAGSAPRSKFQDPRVFLSGLSPVGARAPSRALPRFGASRDNVSAAPIISDTQRRHKRHRSLGDSQVGERAPPRSRLRPSRVSGAKKSRPPEKSPPRAAQESGSLTATRNQGLTTGSSMIAHDGPG